MCLLFFTVLNFYVAIVLSAPVVGLALMLAFYQVNGRPFVVVLEHGFYYLLNTKLYLWKQREVTQKLQEKIAPAATIAVSQVPMLSEQSRLKDLSAALVTAAQKSRAEAESSDKPAHPSTHSFKI